MTSHDLNFVVAIFTSHNCPPFAVKLVIKLATKICYIFDHFVSLVQIFMDYIRASGLPWDFFPDYIMKYSRELFGNSHKFHPWFQTSPGILSKNHKPEQGIS